jgi:hypothetical protein
MRSGGAYAHAVIALDEMEEWCRIISNTEYFQERQ